MRHKFSLHEMNSESRRPKESPKKSARLFSKLFFTWLIKLIYKGTKRTLKVDDLYEVMPSDDSSFLTDKLERNWHKEIERARKKHSKPSLLRALWNTFFWNFLFYGFLLFVLYTVLRPFQPVILALFIQLFSEDTTNGGESLVFDKYLYGTILIVITVFVIFISHHVYLELSRVGMRIRIACCSLIYRKVLKLSKKSLGQIASGQIVNLLSNDVQRFDLVMPVLHFFWIMPIQASLITYFIWEQVQIAAFAGVVAMILMTIPVQGYMGKVASVLRLKVAKRTDYRVKLMNEIISGIQVIKMYTWEQPFEKMVRIARSQEIKFLTLTSYLRGVYSSFSVFTERTTLFFSVICYYLLGNQITADRVFSMAQFFNILQLSMAIFFPLAVSLGAESLVSIQRLENILNLEEKTESSILRTSDRAIILEDVEATWTLGMAVLENLNFRIPPGCLCAIVGPVGSGKSSVLQLLLGELQPDSGTVQIGGEISYASQEPWLFLATVRRNILFGKDFDRDRYLKVVEICSLEKDFELFPEGDQTLVGERGVSLSGGQRARINLARAIYKDADVYVLDDPLSAVDTHVAKHLFEECIVNYLEGKTRILVTHQLQFLKKVDYIIVLNEGKIEATGTFEELSHCSERNFTKLFRITEEVVEDDKSQVQEKPRILSTTSIKTNVTQSENIEKHKNPEETVLSQGNAALFSYIKSSENCLVLFVLLLLLLFGQLATTMGDIWLTYWTTSEQNTPTHNDYFNMYVYIGFIIISIVFTTIRSLVFFKLCMRASKNLHNKMFHTLLKAPMRFFDTNPSGRILNRFSRDMGAIDEILPRVSMDALQILLVMSGILVMITIANYYMVIAGLILGTLFYKMRQWYIKAAKDIKHLEGITKSPLFSHLNASLQGILTIRVNNSQAALKSEFDTHQNLHTSAWYLTIVCFAAFGIWLDLICLIFIACITFGFVVMSEYSQVNGSYVGLALSQGLILTGMLQFGMRQTAEVVSQLTCVERVLEYTQLPQEEKKEEIKIVKQTKEKWPENGKIQFVNLSLLYSENDPPVVKNLNFVIRSGEKVGIVGRTGAGKSSIITALFRMALIEGNMYIDGVDTRTLPLKDLRCKISIIPQEPVLFSATMRFNLDPFDEFEDEALWSALEVVELKQCVPSLTFQIDEGGSNFSVGQRQLICLARAILRNNKILVLDEATANVDHRTDSLIQDTIRKKFSTCTVLTIAHRLNTIMDSDKVLVMEAGSVMEFDHPFVLLQNEDGYFSKMLLQTGTAMSARLKEIAEKCYDETNLTKSTDEIFK